MKRITLFLSGLLVIGIGWWFLSRNNQQMIQLQFPLEAIDWGTDKALMDEPESGQVLAAESYLSHPLTIQSLRSREYDGGELKVEQTLAPMYNSDYYVVSYDSDGLKQYVLLTIPKGEMPEGGWPAIVFNHGYISPGQYRTTERYAAYVSGLAKAGYVVFRPDYRGHGNSEGFPEGTYNSPVYVYDILNGLEALKKHPQVNPDRIGMWGHSMGGHLLLKAMVISDDIKAGSIWAGVVAPLDEVFEMWKGRRPTWNPQLNDRPRYYRIRDVLYADYGEPHPDSKFWQAVTPNNFLHDLSGPLQLHHGTGDASVDWEISESLHKQLEEQGIEHEYYLYNGADHNLSGKVSDEAMERTVEFFSKHLT